MLLNSPDDMAARDITPYGLHVASGTGHASVERLRAVAHSQTVHA